MEAVNKLQISRLVKITSIIVLGTLLLAISAKIQIHLFPVPMTMQTFVVLFLGMAFGYKIGLATVSLYLFEGLIGIPVFAKGGGLIYFTGPTAGYLIGFLFSVFFAGYLKLKSDPMFIFLKLIFSVSFIYFFGLIWLGFYGSWEKSLIELFNLGAKPFLLAETYKILILTTLSYKIIKLRNII